MPAVKIRVLAFATARQTLGQAELDLELASDSTVADLATILQEEYPDLVALWPRLAVAVDGVLVDPDCLLREGSEVALLPPVSGGAPLERSALVDGVIDPAALAAEVADPTCGALLLFVGHVRESNGGRAVCAITYDAYRPMAERALERIANDLESDEPRVRIRIVHRLGEIRVGEASVAIAVASPHRDSAYRANRRALERLKREVPIWKLEHYADGEMAWREDEPLAGPIADLVERLQELES